MTIYCTGCERDVEARLTNGVERYPHRPDLAQLPFWKCDACGAYVGCHHKTTSPTRPMGTLATTEMLEARKAIHELIDPIWQSGDFTRGEVYAYMKHELGYSYHTGELRTMEQARDVWRVAAEANNKWKFENDLSFSSMKVR